MTGIQIGNEFLDLSAGAVIEMEDQNPFLQFDENLIGEFSYPFNVRCTEKNDRLLGYPGIPQVRVNPAGVDALLYDKSLQVASGKVKIEKVNSNINRRSASTVDCYFLTKASSFWQDAKGKSLRSIEAGGDRTFAWEGYITTGTGFWKHLNDVFFSAPNTYDYAFFPVRNNQAITTSIDESRPDYDRIINKVYFDVVNDRWIMRGQFCPFPYLHYIIKKAMAFVGWTVSGDILDDDNFRKITILNTRSIDWAYIRKTGNVIDHHPYDSITFNLNQHLPDMEIGAFLIAIKNKFGLHLDFDRVRRHLTISLMDSILDMPVVDMTSKASPLLPKTIKGEKSIYAMVYADGRGSISLENTFFQGELASRDDLPAAAEALHDQAYYISMENKYVICKQNETDDNWDWQAFGDNNNDYAPAGKNNEISTKALIPGMELYTDFYNRRLLVPFIDDEIESIHNNFESVDFPLYLCYYHGLRALDNPDPGTLNYPLGSSSVYDIEMNQLADWGLTFTCFKPDGTDIGLYTTFWERFLALTNGEEEYEVNLYLPLHEYMVLKFSDRIVINGIHLFIRNIKSAIPYKGVIQCVCIRL
ncbi:MAG: hypothetical protein IAE96_04880 [Chitinophagaceae bacterium]|nr:hypothetical protein [Chitinophagaceae bacterium]